MTSPPRGQPGSSGGRVDVVVQGDIPYQAHRWAVLVLDRALRHDPWPLVHADVRLTRPAHLVATCRADIRADLGGHMFHVRGEAREARTALDIAVERLHRQAVALHAARTSPHRSERLQAQRAPRRFPPHPPQPD
jgi:ribosome-associated translation inhibitor RaiA